MTKRTAVEAKIRTIEQNRVLPWAQLMDILEKVMSKTLRAKRHEKETKGHL